MNEIKSTASLRSEHVNAISISSNVARMISKHSVIGQVHSVFRRSFNIITGADELIGVVRKDVPNGPANIVTDLPLQSDFISLDVRVGMKVRKSRNRLSIGSGSIVVSLENVREWDPRKRIYGQMDNPQNIRNKLKVVQQLIKSKARHDGLGQLVGDIERIISGGQVANWELNEIAKKALASIQRLISMFRARNFGGLKENAKDLVGLGIGLTPSADDMLAGFMASNVILSNFLNDEDTYYISKVNKSIISMTKGRTNLFSQQLLRYAAIGEVNESIGDLIEAIITTTTDKVMENTNRVLEIGETSGADTVLGILLSFHIIFDKI